MRSASGQARIFPFRDRPPAGGHPGRRPAAGSGADAEGTPDSPLSDKQGTRTLITPYGGAYFPDGLRAAHNFCGDLLSTYKEENAGQGIAIHKELRFGENDAAWLQGESGLLRFTSQSVHDSDRGENRIPVATWMGHAPSVSLFAPQNRDSDTFIIRTEGDFILLDNRLEANGRVGITGSLTRMEEGCLFLSGEHRLQSVAGGVKHYGLAMFTAGIRLGIVLIRFGGIGLGDTSQRHEREYGSHLRRGGRAPQDAGVRNGSAAGYGHERFAMDQRQLQRG